MIFRYMEPETILQMNKRSLFEYVTSKIPYVHSNDMTINEKMPVVHDRIPVMLS